MATWTTERGLLSTAISTVFKVTGSGAYTYTEIDKDINPEKNIPIGQKKRNFRIELVAADINELTSSKVLGRYTAKVTLYFIAAQFDFETYKSEVLAHLNTLINSYNYNIVDQINFTIISDRQAECNFTLEVGLNS